MAAATEGPITKSSPYKLVISLENNVIVFPPRIHSPTSMFENSHMPNNNLRAVQGTKNQSGLGSGK